jgi:hypothetical protein
MDRVTEGMGIHREETEVGGSLCALFLGTFQVSAPPEAAS